MNRCKPEGFIRNAGYAGNRSMTKAEFKEAYREARIYGTFLFPYAHPARTAVLGKSVRGDHLKYREVCKRHHREGYSSLSVALQRNKLAKRAGYPGASVRAIQRSGFHELVGRELSIRGGSNETSMA